MPTKPNKLQRLVEQFEALPRQKELKQTKFQLGTIATRVDDCTKQLENAFGQTDVLREVQSKPDLLQDEVTRLLKSLQPHVQILASQLLSNEIQRQRITSALDTLAKTSGQLSQLVKEAWAEADDTVVASTEALIDLTGAYDLEAQRTLKQALSRFMSARAPSDQQGIITYRQALEALENARLSLKIPGEVGAFLMDALRGIGSVKKLVDPKVWTFLDEHPRLWSRLFVRLD
jgi:hypothetical protein